MTRTVVCLTLALGALALGMAAGLAGCNGVDKKYSQTELNALQTREFNYNFDQTFDAAVGALFDLGYTVYTSDKRAGLLGARAGSHSVQLKVDPAGEGRTSVRVSTSSGGQAHVDKGRIDDVLNTIDRRLTASPAKAGKP
jgi:hypothetical protein